MPNIQTKTFWSDALERPIKLTVSMKALRTIRKKGSLDNYLLSFSSTQLRSRIGDTLKQAIVNKLKDPDSRVPYIPNIYGKLVNPTKRRQSKMPYPIWIPPELRHQNLEEYRYPPRELQKEEIYVPPTPEELAAMNIQPEAVEAEDTQKLTKKERLKRVLEGGERALHLLNEKSPPPEFKPSKAQLKEQQKKGISFKVALEMGEFNEKSRKK